MPSVSDLVLPPFAATFIPKVSSAMSPVYFILPLIDARRIASGGAASLSPPHSAAGGGAGRQMPPALDVWSRRNACCCLAGHYAATDV
jgi:hypothetical protein